MFECPRLVLRRPTLGAFFCVGLCFLFLPLLCLDFDGTVSDAARKNNPG